MKNAITRTKLTCVSMATVISEDAARLAKLMQGATEADITARIEDAEELRTKAIELTRQTKYLQKLTSRTPVDAAARAAQLGDIEALAITYFVEATRRADETMAEFERRCIVVPAVGPLGDDKGSACIRATEVNDYLTRYAKLGDETIEAVIAYLREHCNNTYMTTSARPWSESKGCRCAFPGGRVEKHREGCRFAR
jgi:hypothetical protein